MNTLLMDAEGIFKFIGKCIADIWSAIVPVDTQMLTTDLVQILQPVGVALQNAQPGVSAKSMGTQLLASAETAAVGDLAALGYEDLMIAVATVIKDLNPSQSTGNAGVVS